MTTTSERALIFLRQSLLPPSQKQSLLLHCPYISFSSSRTSYRSYSMEFVYNFFHLVVRVWESFMLLMHFLLLSSIPLIDKPQFIYLLYYWWAFRLPLVLCYYKEIDVNILIYFSLCVHICFHFSWVNSGSWGRYKLNFVNITRAFWMWLYHSPLPPINVWGLSSVYILTSTWFLSAFFKK